MKSPIVQVAWVVSDLDAAMRTWTEVQGVGPFFTLRHFAASNIRYRGRPGTMDVSLAVAQSDGIQVELIQQHCDSPSPYREVYAPGQEGFHHLAHIVPDLDAAVAHYAARGIEVVISAEVGAIRYAYVDTRATLGQMTELVGDHPDVRGLFKVVADAAVGWDGRDPVRALG